MKAKVLYELLYIGVEAGTESAQSWCPRLEEWREEKEVRSCVVRMIF